MLEEIQKTLKSLRHETALKGSKLRIRNQIVSVVEVSGTPTLQIEFEGSQFLNQYPIRDGKLGHDQLDPNDPSDMECLFIEPNYSSLPH
jgi:hypothetical protein